MLTLPKRIAEIIKRRNKQRLAKAAALAKKEAAGDYSHLKNKKGELIAKPLPQPTLPNVSIDDDRDDVASIRTRGPPPSTLTGQSDYYYADYKAPVDYGVDYPPMPAYAQTGYHQYNGSIGTLPDSPQVPYEDEYAASQVHLSSAAAPFGQTDDHASMQHSAYGGYDSYDPYRSPGGVPDYRSPSAAPDYRSPSAAPDYRSGSVAPDYRSGSVAPDYRSGSAAPDYRSASTAPYGQQYQQQAHGQYHQEEYPNPYSPGPQNMFAPAQHGYQPQQHQQQMPYDRRSGGSDGYDNNSAGHVHAM